VRVCVREREYEGGGGGGGARERGRESERASERERGTVNGVCRVFASLLRTLLHTDGILLLDSKHTEYYTLYCMLYTTITRLYTINGPRKPLTLNLKTLTLNPEPKRRRFQPSLVPSFSLSMARR